MERTEHEGTTYIDSTSAAWEDAGPGSRRLVLRSDDSNYVALVRWEPGFELPYVDRHGGEELVYVLDGTFVDEYGSSGPKTVIKNAAGTSHRPGTPDGVTFLVVRTLGGDESAPATVSRPAP